MKPSSLILAASILFSGQALAQTHSGVLTDSMTTSTALPATADISESLDPSLNGIIRSSDSDRLVSDREKALAILENIPADAYGRNEIPAVRRQLTSRRLNISDRELASFKRVRSIQVSDMGIFSYPYFLCRFKKKEGRLFFEKTTGSQRKSGYIYDNRPDSKVFLGGWSVNNDPQTTYDSENSVAGKIYRIAADRIIMLFIAPDGRSFEIYELKK